MKMLLTIGLLIPFCLCAQDETMLLESDTVVSDFQAITVFEIPDVNPTFIGGSNGLATFIDRHINAPLISLSSEERSRTGKTMSKPAFAWVEAVVESNGSVSAQEIRVPAFASEIEGTRIKSVVADLISQMPELNPAQLRGKSIPSQWSLQIPLNGTGTDAYYFEIVEKQPQFLGGADSLEAYLKTNIRYPDAASSAGVGGTVVVNVIIDKTGRLNFAQIVKPVHSALDAEALRVVNEMPLWQPGSFAGKPVHVSQNIPVRFRLNGSAEGNPEKLQNEEVVMVETLPVYPKGEAALMKHIQKSVVWPDSLKEKGIEGRIIAQFVVNKEGGVEAIEIIRGLHPVIDASVVEGIRTCEKWVPGRQRGKAVKVKYSLPVRFDLDGYEPKRKKKKKKK